MMVERIGIIENMKEDEELELLLGEIPYATSLSLNHHHHHHHHHNHHLVNGNPYVNASIVPLTINRMMYGMFDVDVNDYSPANTFQSMFYNGHSSSDTSSSSSSSHDHIPKPYISLRNPYLELPESSFRKEVDENLIDQLGRMYINQEQNEALLSSARFGDSGNLAANPPFSRIRMNPDSEMNQAFLGFQQNCGQYEDLVYRSNLDRSVLDYCFEWGIPAQIGNYLMDERMQNVPYMTRSKAAKSNTNHNPLWFNHMAAGSSSNIRTNRGGFRPGLGSLAASEDSFIIQGEEDLSGVRKGFTRPCENGLTKVQLPTSSLLTEGQRYISVMAKDQHGCRLLQKIFDDGNPQHVQTVFNEIIEHVVELMINPFGNYLMQKLLEVCNEEQRMHILMVVMRQPRELVQISLNTHGTRVVQKLIETITTRLQIKLVISALEQGFLSLVKDLNGNHVIQRCLQCLSNEDNKFIFETASKFCVEIATHQHGCCVLQRCINHSTGEHREKLVSEISENALALAQDAFGNYVVQYILELQIPSAVSKLTSQFEGNYVHLATQKFSSHVVEKCLALLDSQSRSTIIRELILSSNFQLLLQDPHGNYVVQTALRVSEGLLHNSLVNVIESHKAISRNSPYAKRIFSNKLLRR